MAEKEISLRHYNEMNEELEKLIDGRTEIYPRLARKPPLLKRGMNCVPPS